MKQMSLKEFQAKCSEHWPSIMDVEFICPACETIQTGHDLVEAGAGKDYDEVNGLLGFSCIGRFNNKAKGCDWTLGGLLQLHTLELTDGHDTRPCFEINFPTKSNEKH